MTPADIIAYQRDMIRRREYKVLGKIARMQFAPSGDWQPPADDPYIAKFGRIMEFRGRFLPFAESLDRTMLLITAPMIAFDENGDNKHVGLPDVPDPEWVQAPWTQDESLGKVKRDPLSNRPKMIPQRLADRAERINGRPALLEGTNFLIFQPVTQIQFQPEVGGELMPDLWFLGGKPSEAKPEDFYDPATQTYMVLLVDFKTGESFFYGGRYEFYRGPGAIET